MPTFTGTAASENFTAPTAEDWTIFGKGGNDVLVGNLGNDSIYGGTGNDTLNGGGGDDLFYVEPAAGSDIYMGGAGLDRVVATADNVAFGISSFSGIEEFSAEGFANVTIKGPAGGATLDFSAVNLVGIASINGGTGIDHIIGSVGDDTINGGLGNDVLSGGDGDDIFAVGAGGGSDRFDGGTGTNTITAIADNVAIGITSVVNVQEISAGGFANVTITGQALSDNLNFTNITLTDIVAINGGLGDDTIRGSAGDDTINGGFGNDHLYGGDGNDTLSGGAGQNYLSGGAGDDIFLAANASSADSALNTYVGGTGYDIVTGAADNAVILLTTGSVNGIEEINSGGFANVTIGGTVGVDVIDLHAVVIAEGDIAAINGNDGNDTIIGTAGADTINGGTGDDTVKAGAGDDIIDGGAGFDVLDGGAGADTVHGGIGDDTIKVAGGDFAFGDDGNDTFLAGVANGFNNFDGGAGIDLLKATGNTNIGIASITGIESISANGFTNVSLTTTADGGTLDFTGIELIGIKSLLGGVGNDTITGSNGDDVVIGGQGADTLAGGLGNDTVSGGIGLDVLAGGTGADIFKDTKVNLAGDRITDFTSEDSIVLTNVKLTSNSTLTFDNDSHLLTVDPDGAGAQAGFSIGLDGTFDPTHFHFAAFGASGSVITYTDIIG